MFKLAVALALRHNGEVINGDALQLYKGLPIVTNKLPEPQRKGVPHHLLGCVNLDEQSWTVRQYHERARALVNDIRSRNKLPIVVGGTHYYVQSLITSNSTMLEPESPKFGVQPLTESPFPILKASTSEIFRELQRLDPVTAAHFHPNDRRKVQRSLEICLQNGRPASQVYQDRKDRAQDTSSTPAVDTVPVFDDVLIFWTHANATQLNARLGNRVDQMLSKGLIQEVEDLYRIAEDYKFKDRKLDESHGIWTAIGYKEFLPFVTQKQRCEAVKLDCVERTKIATRQYAKRQNRWIRLKLMPTLSESGIGDRLYPFDASDASKFPDNVQEPASRLTEIYLDGSTLPKPQEVPQVVQERLDIENKVVIVAKRCEACDKTLMTEDQWKAHLKSKGHRHATQPKPNWEAFRERLKHANTPG